MANLRAADVTKDGMVLTGLPDRTFTVTRQEILTFYQAQQGNAAARKAATITWLKNNIVAALGAENVDPANLIVDFDATDGTKQITFEL